MCTLYAVTGHRDEGQDEHRTVFGLQPAVSRARDILAAGAVSVEILDDQDHERVAVVDADGVHIPGGEW
jgi:hypothetical protein